VRYACPQTVWLEFMFRPIEAWLEGGPVTRKPLNLGRERAQVRHQGAKWSIWTLVALLMSSTFVCVLHRLGPLVHGPDHDPSREGAVSVMLAVAA